MKLTPSVNFINVFCVAFTREDPKSVKWYWWLDWVLTLLWSTHVKAAGGTLMKLSPSVTKMFTSSFCVNLFVIQLLFRHNLASNSFLCDNYFILYTKPHLFGNRVFTFITLVKHCRTYCHDYFSILTWHWKLTINFGEKTWIYL